MRTVQYRPSKQGNGQVFIYQLPTNSPLNILVLRPTILLTPSSLVFPDNTRSCLHFGRLNIKRPDCDSNQNLRFYSITISSQSKLAMASKPAVTFNERESKFLCAMIKHNRAALDVRTAFPSALCPKRSFLTDGRLTGTLSPSNLNTKMEHLRVVSGDI